MSAPEMNERATHESLAGRGRGLRIKGALAFLAIAICLAGTGRAEVFERNSVKGLWQFDGTLNSHWSCQPPIAPSGFPIPSTQGAHYLPAVPPYTYLDLGSSVFPYAGLVPSERFLMPNPTGPNGPLGATGTHSWTLMMDVRFASITGWTALMQSDSTNTTDAEIFLNASRELRLVGSTSGLPASNPLVLNTWYRLTFRAEYSPGLGVQILRVYVNGTVTTQTAGNSFQASPNGRYSLPSQVPLFSDDNNETARVDVGSIAFWGAALPDSDILAIGAVDNDGIDWPLTTPPGSCPPIPTLTGNMKFGSLTMTYTPNQAVIAATAGPPTVGGAVASVQIALGSSGGSIPGLPNHHFGGTLTANVFSNGDVSVNQAVNVNYLGGGPDLATAAGVSYTRSGLTLSPSGARGNVRVFLPSGFGVALTPYGKNTLVRASLSNIPLGSAFNPLLSVNLTRGSFTTDLSSTVLYPMVDRVPVRFATGAILWNASSGRFTFTPTGNLVFHREPQLGVLLNQILAGRPGAANPSSNDFYFLAAKESLADVEIGTRPNGAAALESAHITLDPQKFGTPGTTIWMHYPLMPVTWDDPNDSEMWFVNDEIDLDSSKLRGATLSGTGYLQGVENKNCAGTPGQTPPPIEQMHFLPDGGEWRFNRDGGLRAGGGMRADSTTTNPLTVEWGAFHQGSLQYAHRILTGFSEGRVCTAGIAARADLLTGLADHEKPAALLFSGHSSPADPQLLERPGTEGFYDGVADYPGFNLRCTSGGFSAVSVLAGNPVPEYPLSPDAKYVLRPAGVTGRHLTHSSAPNITFQAYGANFELTALNLAFQDGENVASGVNGVLDTGPPASFDLSFKGLKFGAQGQLQEASIATPQADKILGPSYWSLEFTPLALTFPQPDVCPTPGPGDSHIQVAAKATLTGLTDEPLVGNISVFNGNLVVESDGKGSPVSSFQPGSQFAVNGPAGGPDWIVRPVTDIQINQHPSTPNGTLTVGGLMELPFFEDMPVVLSADSINTSPTPPTEYVRKPWASLSATPFDPGHLGVPPGVSLSNYRTLATHDPVARQTWQNLITFDSPVNMGADHVFTSRQKVAGDVLMFNLNRAVKTMTPNNAELVFDGGGAVDPLIPQVNVGTLLKDNDLLNLSPALQNAIDGALDTVQGLDALLADHLQETIEPGAQAIAAKQGTSVFFGELGTTTDRAAKLDELLPGLRSDVAAQFSPASSGVPGRWRRDLLAEVSQARIGMQSAQVLVANAANMKALGSAIGNKIGLPGAPVANPSQNTLDSLQVLFARVVAQLQAIEVSLGTGNLATSLNAGLGGTPGIDPVVQAAIDDLKKKWAPSNPNLASGLFGPTKLANFQADLASALTDRVCGSPFAGSAYQLLRLYAGDPQTLSRQALDDTLRRAEQLVAAGLNDAGDAPIKQALGLLGGNVEASRLRGYGRINGDALHELRLDGQARLKTPDLMKFDAWFLLRDLDSSTPASACLVAGGAEAEVAIGATSEFEWGSQTIDVNVGGKVALANGSPVGMSGDFAIIGDFDVSEVTVNSLKLGFGFGANNGYFYGSGTGKLYAMNITAGIFAGQTCDVEVIKHADEDIGELLTDQLGGYQLPITGAMIYAEGGMSLMPLIGIPPSCVLDLRLHGGQGYFAFMDDNAKATAGVKSLQGVSGELLCIVDVSGRFHYVLAGTGNFVGGAPKIDQLSGSSTAKLKGEIGIGWFSVSFSKSVRLKIHAFPFDWDLDL